VAGKIAADGGHAVIIPADVTDLDSVRAAVNRVLAACERIDIVVSSAGTVSLKSFGPMAPGRWHSMIDTNVSGLLNTAHATLPCLLDAAATSARGVADLVTISSGTGRRVGASGGVYAASKHAAGAFRESLRQAVSGRAVRVGLVEPGFVDTRLTAGIDNRRYQFLSPEDVPAERRPDSTPEPLRVNEAIRTPPTAIAGPRG
jgi:NADP-dependent 3-hydroxy acid dehydrogenase YdfG